MSVLEVSVRASSANRTTSADCKTGPFSSTAAAHRPTRTAAPQAQNAVARCVACPAHEERTGQASHSASCASAKAARACSAPGAPHSASAPFVRTEPHDRVQGRGSSGAARRLTRTAAHILIRARLPERGAALPCQIRVPSCPGRDTRADQLKSRCIAQTKACRLPHKALERGRFKGGVRTNSQPGRDARTGTKARRDGHCACRAAQSIAASLVQLVDNGEQRGTHLSASVMGKFPPYSLDRCEGR